MLVCVGAFISSCVFFNVLFLISSYDWRIDIYDDTSAFEIVHCFMV